MDMAAVLGRQPAQLQVPRLQAGCGCHDLACDLREPE